MMKSVLFMLAAIVFLSGCISQAEPSQSPRSAPLMTWSDLTERELPQPTSSHAYGDHPSQFADLWLPDGPGPHPVVLMIHGGCWQKSIADLNLMNYAAEDLRQRGIAVWNVEYRGVDEIGGGYPGTFLDVRNAAHRLIEIGPSLNLEVEQIVAFGHSAGGHLAAWVALQSNIAQGSSIGPVDALPVSTVLISGGLADLEASAPVTLESCLANIIGDLTGTPTADRPNVFSDTSVPALLPTAVTLISVNGDQDRIAPPELGQELTEKVIESGGDGRFIVVPETGHVELIAPGTTAFEIQADILKSALSAVRRQ